MRLHKSLTTSDLAKRHPSALAMMVASEFWRAKAGAAFKSDAIRCFWRARELMGVLEIISLPEAIIPKLLLAYRQFDLKWMFSESRTSPAEIEEFSTRLGETFDQLARELKHA